MREQFAPTCYRKRDPQVVGTARLTLRPTLLPMICLLFGMSDWVAKPRTERWAFAFSAKKDWQDKFRSDVAKIAATKRNYKKAFRH